MNEYEKLLALCRSCISSLNSALETDLPNSDKLQLQQKIFILEAAMDNISLNEINSKDESEFSSLDKENFPSNLKEASKLFEINIIKKAIEMYGSKRKAAKALGLDHSTLIKKCQRYNI